MFGEISDWTTLLDPAPFSKTITVRFLAYYIRFALHQIIIAILFSPGNSPKEFLFIIAFALPCMFIVICYARIFYIVRRTAIRSREPALKPGISTRTIENDRQANNNSNNNNSSSNDEPQQFTAVNMPTNCDNHYQRRRASSSVEEKDSLADDNLAIQTTSQKRRCLLTKIKDEDLKFIDTSVDSSDNNNYLIRNMTGANLPVNGGMDNRSEIGSDEDEEGMDNGLLSAAEKTDSALEEDKEESTTCDAKTMLPMNGSQYLAVVMEPSSSSGIDVALDQDEPIQPM